MAGTLQRSIQLVKESYTVLKKDRELIWFPIVSGIVSILLFVSYITGIVFIQIKIYTNGDYIYNFYGYYVFVGLFLLILLLSFVISFFTTGLVTCANIRLKGGDPTVRDGLRNAQRHIGKIFVWSLVAAIIGYILALLSSRRDKMPFGGLFGPVFGMAWSLLTFFVIPVLIFENFSVIGSIRRSGELFRKTWGETVVGQFSINLVFFLFGLIGIAPLIISFITGSLPTIVIVVTLVIIYWLILGIIASALSGIFVTAVYRFATTGKAPSIYSPEAIKHAFKRK